MSIPSNFEKAVKKRFRSVKAEDFQLFGFDTQVTSQLERLLSAETYHMCENEREIIREFKKLLNIEEMNRLRFERIELNDKRFVFL